MPSIYVTRKISDAGIMLLKEKGYDVDISGKDGVLTNEELVVALKAKPYAAILCLLTDKINAGIFDAVPTAKIFANYAVGFDNVDVIEAKKRGIVISNTPDVLTDTVAEHTFALMLSIAHRIPESDRFTRAGKYVGWGPLLLLGMDMSGKTLGILGAGRIGSRVGYHAVKGFGMKIVYYDVKQNEMFEKETGGTFRATVEEVLREADFVSVHVPLLPTTKHLINAERIAMMKKSAYIVNTSRGPVVDEAALVEALKNGIIRGAALDVFENEPNLVPGLADLENVIITPHIASATEETRAKMAEIAARNIIAVLEGGTAPNAVR